MKYVEHRTMIYRDDSGEWRWRRIAPNNRVVADSGEGYKNKGDCYDIARQQFPDDKFEYPDDPVFD